MTEKAPSILPQLWGLQPYEWLTLVGVIVGPIIAVLISLWIENRRRDRDQKLIILRQLLTTRHLVGDPNYSAAVNLIPVEFAGKRAVLDAYREFIEAVQLVPSPENQERVIAKSVAKQTRMIFEIAKSIGFKIAETDIQTTAYAADGFIQRDNIIVEAWKSWPRIASALEVNNQMLHEMTPNSEPEAK
ncbi:DUF6680 family protein [Sphingobium sp. CAP-1]|uniref:DUF6680 family protein n=1 Tax=Sphingobium sp. CAP-1 TaxID=2676077 RepID=UPI0012BB400A|nr:DUF6680 family protein [Sphingobium sp. CAP-1]QGP80888.1 hypothetical protein GL174_17565 [Sphingobium sp. CAP-1]